MVKLHFTTTDEFETLFKKKTREVTDAIVLGIEIAIANNKKTAQLFEITFQDVDQMFEISLPQSQWKISLESCLDHYHKLEEADKQIDTWKLLELVKTF